MFENNSEFGDQLDQCIDEIEAMNQEEFDPNCFFKALSNALVQLENFKAEAA